MMICIDEALKEMREQQKLNKREEPKKENNIQMNFSDLLKFFDSLLADDSTKKDNNENRLVYKKEEVPKEKKPTAEDMKKTSHKDTPLCEENFFKVDMKNPTKIEKNKREISEEIHHIRFNGPATIIFWKDGTKTLSVCSENDVYDREKGVVVAILKKVLGNSSYNTILNTLPEIDEIVDKEFEVEFEKNKLIVTELLGTKKLTETQKEAVKFFLDI